MTVAISEKLSGVVINVNSTPRTAKEVTKGTTYYQTLRLPADLQRGLYDREINFPALSGFQLLIGAEVESEPGAVEFDYALEQYFFGTGWVPLASGTSVGVSIAASQVWADVLFDQTVPVSQSMISSESRIEAPTDFRIAITPLSNFKSIWMVTPNPYAQGEALEGAKQLSASFNFRLLALVADSGTDIFGNPYRSVAITSEAAAAGAVPGSGYWLSAPQPSKFAVVSHYSDVRPFPTVLKYGTINLIKNPHFEQDLPPTYNGGTKKWEGGIPALWEPIGGTVLRVSPYRGEWKELETYKVGQNVALMETLADFEERQRQTRLEREKVEEEEVEQWRKEEGETLITHLQREEKEATQVTAAKIKEEEEHNARNTFVAKIKTYSAIAENLGENPLFTGASWEERSGIFESAENGLVYTAVECTGAKQGIRLKNPEGKIELKFGVPVTLSFWIRAENANFKKAATEVQNSAAPGATKITVKSVEGIEAGTHIELPKGLLSSGTEQATVISVVGKELTLEEPLKYSHAKNSVVVILEEVEVKFGSPEVGEVTKNVYVLDEWTRRELTLTPIESGLATASIEVKSAHKFFVDAIMINVGTKAADYIDGDRVNCQWSGIPGRSSSAEIIEHEPKDNEVVIDSVLIDPITPGVGFNIYYSSDLRGTIGEEEPTVEEWEQKLWTHVPQTYTTSGKTTYVLPEPIRAKFIKIEFSHLQGKPYTPGDFQSSVLFKQFPEWITSVFLSLQSSPNFNVTNIGVTYDKLELMYNYYLADLHQAPTSPVPPKTITGPAQDLVDPNTLSQINQIINTYTQPPALLAKPTLLGEAQSIRALQEANYPTEPEPEFNARRTFPVSTLDRENIVIDQRIPVMFFFVTCRHEYVEAFGKFAENKAYYAGLKQLAFLRHTYTTTYDGELYIESGADDVNTERNDFAVEDGVWYTN